MLSLHTLGRHNVNRSYDSSKAGVRFEGDLELSEIDDGSFESLSHNSDAKNASLPILSAQVNLKMPPMKPLLLKSIDATKH